MEIVKIDSLRDEDQEVVTFTLDISCEIKAFRYEEWIGFSFYCENPKGKCHSKCPLKIKRKSKYRYLDSPRLLSKMNKVFNTNFELLLQL
jgi:hypothetical protein